MPTCLAVIPARWGASRLPGKPLADIRGVPMVEHVRRRVCRAQLVQRVVVATDDDRIARAVEAHGGEVMLTGERPTGTHRVAAVAERLPHDLILNVQGDMPLIEAEHVDAVVRLLLDGAPLATLATPLADPASPHQVKVVLDQRGRALYFSRQPIPARGPWLRHVGIYGFKSEVLRHIMTLPPGALERSEGLEQLRWLDHGVRVQVGVVSAAGPSVDTAEQLAHVRALTR